jgi:hypothetical protein
MGIPSPVWLTYHSTESIDELAVCSQLTRTTNYTCREVVVLRPLGSTTSVARGPAENLIATESMPLQTLRKQKKRKWAYGCRRARAQYISAFDWILAFSLFLCMFLHLKTVMAWSLELGVLCKSGHQSGHPGDSCPKRLLPKPFVARWLVPLLWVEVCW